MPHHVYGDVHRLNSVLPLRRTDPRRHAAFVIDPSRTSVALPLAARLGEWLRRQGWNAHLIAIGDGRLTWSQEHQDIFESIIPFQVTLLRLARAASARDAYLGTPVPSLDPELVADAVGTLAGFDITVCIQHGLAHGLMGRLEVETWAVVGLGDEALAPADVINACAAYEHAYQTVIALDPGTYRLCLALGIPAEKLRRWGEYADADWDDCRPLDLSRVERGTGAGGAPEGPVLANSTLTTLRAAE